MANADGSVIFSCDLDSTKAQKKLSKLRDEISELNSKLEKETGNKMNLEKQLDAASQAAKATEERVKMLRKEVERLNDREWIQKQGFTQNEYQTQVLDRRAAAEAELKQQEELLHTQTKEVKTLSAAYEETTANIDSMTVKLDKAKVAAGELIANTEQERREREAENSALAKAGQYAARFRDQVKSLARSMLVFSVITAALMALRKQIKAAIATSAEASDAFARLKGALLTLAAPLMDVLIPALTWLMNLLAAIVSEIVTIISILSGKSKKSMEASGKNLYKEAAAIDATGKAAKEATDALAAFDEINKLSTTTSVGGGGGDGAGVHQAHGGELSLAWLGALAVGEVAGGVPQGQTVVGGHVPCAEAGTAEAGFDDGAGGQQVGGGAHLHQLQGHGHGGGVHVEAEGTGAGIVAADDIRRLGDVVKQTAGAAGDDALVGPDGAVVDLAGELGVGLGEAALGVGLHLGQQLLGIFQELVDGPGVGGVEGQGDHGLHPAQVDGDHLIIIGVLARVQGLVVLGPLVGLVEAPGDLVGLPDGGQTRGLRGHHVDAIAEVDGQALDAGACKLQNAVVHKAAFKGGLHQGDGHVVGANALPGLAGEIHQHHLGHGGVPGVLQQLLGQLRAALAHGHGAQGAIAGVGVGAQDHGAALGHLLPGVGVDHALVGGDVDAAVLLGGGRTYGRPR